MKLKNEKFDNFVFIAGNFMRCPLIQSVPNGFSIIYKMIEIYEWHRSNTDLSFEATYAEIGSDIGIEDLQIKRHTDRLCETGLISKKRTLGKMKWKFSDHFVTRYWMRTTDFLTMIKSETDKKVDFETDKKAHYETDKKVDFETDKKAHSKPTKKSVSYIENTEYIRKENFVKENSSFSNLSKGSWQAIESKIKIGSKKNPQQLQASYQDAPEDFIIEPSGRCRSKYRSTDVHEPISKMNQIANAINRNHLLSRHKSMYIQDFNANNIPNLAIEGISSMIKGDLDAKVLIHGGQATGKTHLITGIFKQMLMDRAYLNRPYGVGNFFFGTLDDIDRIRKSAYDDAKATNQSIPTITDILGKYDAIFIDEFSVHRLNAVWDRTLKEIYDFISIFSGCVFIASVHDKRHLPIPSDRSIDLDAPMKEFKTIELKKP